MPTRDVRVDLGANVTNYVTAMRQAEAATRRWAEESERAAARVRRAMATPASGTPGAPAGGGGAPTTNASGRTAAQEAEIRRLNANEARARRAQEEQAQAAERAAQARARAEQERLAKQAEAMQEVGETATAMGGAMAAGLALAAKAAIDWESAWAGVEKTVDGSAQQMAELEGQLRGMARELPASHQEIAAVAEAAGQLGVKREDIAGFTKTMVDLGVSTNLSADEAATSIAQMMNVMQTAPEDVGRLGAALVALGNAGASTEAEILDMSQRLSGAGALIGATEADVLALANAMASMGIQSELGGGAMSRVLLGIYQAVKEAGPRLDAFAKTAGMSAQEFATAFGNDPIRAMDSFVKGLGRIKDGGGNVIAALDDVSIKGTQNLQVILRLAGAGDLLTESLDLGAKAWEQNTALTDEANKRYETTAARLQTMKNNVVDVGITFGEVMLPAIQKVTDVVSAFAGVLNSMPGPAREIAVLVGAVATAVTLMSGAFLLAAPRIAATKAALRDLNNTSAGTTAGMKKMAAATAIVAGGIYALNKLGGTNDKIHGFAVSASALELSLVNLGKTGAVSGELAKVWGDNLDKLSGDVDRLINKNTGEKINDALGGFWDAVGIKTEYGGAKASAALKELDAALTNMARSGAPGEAIRAYGELAERLQAAGVPAERLVDLFPTYAETLRSSAAAAQRASGETGDLATDIKGMAQQAGLAQLDIKGLKDAIDGLIDGAFSAQRAADAYARGINSLRDQVKSAIEEGDQYARSLRGNSEAALNNRAAVMDLVEATKDQIKLFIDSGAGAEDVAAKTRQLKRALEDQLVQMNFNRTEVRKYTGVLDGIPTEISTMIGVDTSDAKAKVRALKDELMVIAAKQWNIDLTATTRSTSGGTTKKAAGGPVYGPGGPTSDSIPAWLSNGEYVINAAATSRHRPTLDAINSGRYATGGPVAGYASRAMGATLAAALPGGVVVVRSELQLNVNGGQRELVELVQGWVRQNAGGDVQRGLGGYR